MLRRCKLMTVRQAPHPSECLPQMKNGTVCLCQRRMHNKFAHFARTEVFWGNARLRPGSRDQAVNEKGAFGTGSGTNRKEDLGETRRGRSLRPPSNVHNVLLADRLKVALGLYRPVFSLRLDLTDLLCCTPTAHFPSSHCSTKESCSAASSMAASASCTWLETTSRQDFADSDPVLDDLMGRAGEGLSTFQEVHGIRQRDQQLFQVPVTPTCRGGGGGVACLGNSTQ